MHDSSYLDTRTLQLPFSDGDRTVRIWESQSPPKALILGIHGGLSHSGDYATVGNYFCKHQVTTISFDLYGHGRKPRIDIPGFDVFMEDAVHMLDWVRITYATLPVFVMGHSMGALIATHLELSGRLRTHPIHERVRGVILSSPYYANAIPVAPLLITLSGLLAKFFPTAKVPMEDLIDRLTHDAEITARHRQDQASGRRASQASFRFGRALLDAQAALNQDLRQWQHPLFAVLAGDDKLADVKVSRVMLNTVRPELLALHDFASNFHENFNELNREQIFHALHEWMHMQIAAQAQ